MSRSGFLYRRLARWITCELPMLDGRLPLADKYQVASCADVFMTPFYWQLYGLMRTSPRLVVDCGAHCGHFAALAEVCVRYRFGTAECRYVLVEADPRMLRRIDQTLRSVGMANRARVVEAMLGVAPDADPTLWVNSKNPLSTSMTRQQGTRMLRGTRGDLASLVGEATIDVMKIDIEGAEYTLIEREAAVLSRTKLLFVELHPATESARTRLLDTLQACGLQMLLAETFAGNEHAIFARP